MDQLSPLDAAFLEAEDADRHVSLALGAVAVLEGPMPVYDSIADSIATRVAKVARLQQVLLTHRLDLAAPQWKADPHFDPYHHIHRAALPHGGDDGALFRFVADVMERRLDRDRPLWECWIIEGVEGGRWALLMKMHHCIADGIATVQVLSGLSDQGNRGTFATEIRAAAVNADAGPKAAGINLNPLGWVNAAWRGAAALPGAMATTLAGAAQLAMGLLDPAAGSSLRGPVTTMRRYSAAQVRLRDVEKVASVFDVTLNDVALAAITSSYRDGLRRRGTEPQRTSLRTLVPVSVRDNNALERTDNRVSLMLPLLPVEKQDPVQQLQSVHRRLARSKRTGQREAGSIFVGAVSALPFPLTAWAVRMLMRLPQRGVVTLATNVPGPRRRLKIMGCRVLRILPVPPIALQLRTGVAILSYADGLYFGITADYDAASDVDELARGIERAVQRLTALAAHR
ncbi:wax ester/triacylglycerol synthase family O-acyltransferase [Mycolicibacterium cosmeticum]|uniref:Diacylglycerol O-acyltransferase n=1 Tax=Mycolicibacterium cosmeticum TaxID=258533 RepID=W9B7M4_MYCCO|nr:wax ester/triacylglycerol synthase family O-acyltransferase [Mycolicibacterium cosmeticum]TLH74055.1 wax ester/triacylglycerol synthase family O-acyltransferase [Mycolicibacterium cosmeticum]CDO10987.1 acyltransferase, WS/DGAT/MGAT [Mycolicibacterium cosmeticum]